MTKNQIIPLITVKYFDNLTDPDNPRAMYRAALSKAVRIVGDKLLQNVADHSNQKLAQVVALLETLPEAIADYLVAGHAVQIKDLCTIKPRIKVEAKDSAAECTVDTIKSVGISITPIGATRELFKRWHFQMTDKVVELNNASTGAPATSTPSTVNVVFQFASGRQEVVTGIPGSPLTAPALTAADNVWSPRVPEVFPSRTRAFREIDEGNARIYYTFQFADGTCEDVSGIEGDTVTAPQNTEGYCWPSDVPATFGSANRTFVEQAAAPAATYTITFEFNGGTTQTATLAAGAAITYPANTSGYQWPTSKPTVMPAQNVTVTEERNPNQPPPATGGGESGFE